MARSSPLPTPPGLSNARVASIVALVGRGMTPRAIRKMFPELKPDAVRAALLQAAELLRDEDTSLQPVDDPVGAMIASAQQNSGMSEKDALKLAVSETRAVRRARAARKK